MGFGHTATLLINQDEQAILFSYYPDDGKIFDRGEARIGVLSHDQWYPVLYGNGSSTKNSNSDEAVLLAITGEVAREGFDRRLYLEVTPQEGYAALQRIEQIYNNPGDYDLFSNNCDHVTASVVSAANRYYIKDLAPNESFKGTTLYHTNPLAYYSWRAHR